MDPITHTGLTVALLTGAKLIGLDVNNEICLAAVAGGVFLDADKIIEIIVNQNKKNKGITPDITARCRILHSIFAFPFGLFLSFAVLSWLPLFAVLLHIAADSLIPALEMNGKYYPSHSLFKWIAVPFINKSWTIVTIGWPIVYLPKLTWVYNKLGPAIGTILLVASIIYWLL